MLKNQEPAAKNAPDTSEKQHEKKRSRGYPMLVIIGVALAFAIFLQLLWPNSREVLGDWLFGESSEVVSVFGQEED